MILETIWRSVKAPLEWVQRNVLEAQLLRRLGGSWDCSNGLKAELNPISVASCSLVGPISSNMIVATGVLLEYKHCHAWISTSGPSSAASNTYDVKSKVYIKVFTNQLISTSALQRKACQLSFTWYHHCTAMEDLLENSSLAWRKHKEIMVNMWEVMFSSIMPGIQSCGIRISGQWRYPASYLIQGDPKKLAPLTSNIHNSKFS